MVPGPAQCPVPLTSPCTTVVNTLITTFRSSYFATAHPKAPGDDFDEMFRFRLGNLERLWGVIRDGVFYAIWWDPNHQVCPGKDKD